MKTEYTVRKKNGSWWVMTPEGEAIAVPHKTKVEARMIANVFNHTKRDPKTVRTLADEKKERYVLITISGGVGDIALKPKDVEVDILDFDNLKDTMPGDAILSDREWEYLKKNDPEEFARLMG